MKKKFSGAAAFALSLALIGGGVLSVGTAAFTYAATIDSTAESWKTAANGNTAEGLKDDTVAIVEGVSDGTIQNNYVPRANNAVEIQSWYSSNVKNADPNPFKFQIDELVAQTFGDGDPTAPVSGWEAGHTFSSKEIPGLFDGIKFRYEIDGGQATYYFEGLDYTEMSPLAAGESDPYVTMGDLGQWTLPTTEHRETDPLRAGDEIEFTSSFTPKADYIGSIPPLPLNFSGNGDTKIVSLATKAAEKSYPRTYTSEGYLGSTQQNPTSGTALIQLKKLPGSTVKLNYISGVLPIQIGLLIRTLYWS